MYYMSHKRSEAFRGKLHLANILEDAACCGLATLGSPSCFFINFWTLVLRLLSFVEVA